MPQSNYKLHVNYDHGKPLYGDTTLTEKEWRIIVGIASGLRNQDIAVQIGTTEHVVKNYIRVIYDKTGMSSRLELALWYVSHPVGKVEQAS